MAKPVFSRADLKSFARQDLVNTYWFCLGTGLLASFIPGLIKLPINLITNRLDEQFSTAIESFVENANFYISPTTIITAISVYILFTFLALVLGILTTYPLKIGFTKYCLNIANEEHFELSQLFSPYKEKTFIEQSLAMFTTELIINLWSLLFIIPGIIKSYQYAFVPMLLAENPNMTGKQARELSKKITDGYKMELFVLGLSFIGWCLLGILACGIGVIFVVPYLQMTYIEAYNFLTHIYEEYTLKNT
ncbi:MAG: DUF975 family protein [Ruminococcaceae bacterium]|nr:DUF975 family protein [Oscillospiraceae bacterium]